MEKIFFCLVFCIILIATIHCGPTEPDEKIYKKALQFEKNGQYATAKQAFELLIIKFPESDKVAQAREHLKSLLSKLDKKKENTLAPLAKNQRPTIYGGEKAVTAVEAGLTLTSSDRRELERLILDLRQSLDLPKMEKFPKPNTSSRVPRPYIKEIYYPPVAKVDEPVYIRVVAENIGATARQGGITISFPDKQDYITVFKAERSKTDIKVYREGSDIYSAARKAKVSAIYPMAETYGWTPIRKWETYSIALFLVPTRPGVLRFFIRTALRGSGKNFYGYPESGSNDQQDWPVIECMIFVNSS